MSSWFRPLASFVCGLLVVGCFSDVGAGSGGDATTAGDSSSTAAEDSTSDDTTAADSSSFGTSFFGSSTFGTSGTFGTTGTFGTSGTTEVGPQGCGATEQCFDFQLPAGWAGPFLVHSYPPGGGGPNCPAQWSEVAEAPTFADPQNDPLTCECTCGGAVSYDCDFELSAYAGASCGGAETSVKVTPPCTVLPAGTLAAMATGTVNNVQECDLGVATTVGARPAPFSSRIRVCEPERSVSSCDGGECLALPADPPPATQLCVAEGGEQSCDDLGPFTERHLAFASFADTRECESGCSCDATPVCTAELTVTPGLDCLGLGDPVSLGQCVDSPGGGSAAFTGGASSAVCEGPGKQYPSMGGATPEGTATTYCCVAPS